MATPSHPRSTWAFDVRMLLPAAIGAAAYAALGLVRIGVPLAAGAAIQPAIAVVTFVGVVFGPLAGLITGALGGLIFSLLNGMGLSLVGIGSTGLMGLAAGVLAAGPLARVGGRLVGTALVAVVSVAVGWLVVVAWYVTSGVPIDRFVSSGYFLAIAVELVTAAILTALLVRFLEAPLRNALGPGGATTELKGLEELTDDPGPASDLVAYLLAHRDAFTREALTAKLAAAGHAPDAIGAAWAAADAAEPPMTTRQSVLQGIAILLALATAVIGLGTLGLVSSGRPMILLYFILFPLQIIIATRWIVRSIGRSAGLRAGAMDATLGWLLAAPLVLIAIMGGCFAYGGAFGCFLDC